MPVHTRVAVATLTAALAACAAAPAAPAAAQAPTASWSCRGSAVEAQLVDRSRLAPVLADRTACADADTGLPNAGEAVGLAPGLTARTAAASTRATPAGAAPLRQAVAADGGVEGLRLTLVPGLELSVDAARAQATGRCDGVQPVLEGASRVLGLRLNGQEVVADGLLSSVVDPVSGSPLGAVVRVRLAEQLRDGAVLVQRAAHVEVLSGAGPGATALADVVVGEARIAASAACDPRATGNAEAIATEALGVLCPAGSALDTARGLCVIAASASGGMGEVVIGAPRESPSGGSVESLAVARGRHAGSPCLAGAGPDFVIVGTAGADRITGTNRADRVLGLGGDDQLAGGRGDDCLDGGAGSDSLSGSLGADRAFGMAGGDHLNGGSGTDVLDGGTGDDSINTGFGTDVVRGGAGADAINAATAGRPARVDCGAGRDKVRVNRNEAKRLRGCEVRYVIR